MEKENICLKSGQATICVKEDGVLFSVNYLFSKKEKLIPFEKITEVIVGPSWWIFPGFRVIEKGDQKFFVEPGQYMGFNFKHNLVSFPFWKYKKWENLANLIKQKIQ